MAEKAVERLCDMLNERGREIARYRAGLQRIVEGDGFWDAPSIARDLLEGKDVT
jgi:hypothetical protein